MKKMLAVVGVMAAVAIATECKRSSTGGATFRVETSKPYADYQDLAARHVPDDGFSILICVVFDVQTQFSRILFQIWRVPRLRYECAPWGRESNSSAGNDALSRIS